METKKNSKSNTNSSSNLSSDHPNSPQKPSTSSKNEKERKIKVTEIIYNGIKMKAVQSCGILLFRNLIQTDETLIKQFLLLIKHSNEYDLPKGHVEEGETNIITALRELNEETGIDGKAINLDETFSFQEIYFPTYKRFGGVKVHKTITVFLGELKEPVSSTQKEKDLQLTEHKGFAWLDWKESSQNSFQNSSIDNLLKKVAEHWKEKRKE